MLAVNNQGQLVTQAANGRELQVQGVIFMENIYMAKCLLMAIAGSKEGKDKVIDDTIKFSL